MAELLFQIIQCANQASIYAVVTIWEKEHIPTFQSDHDPCGFQRSGNVDIFSELGTGKPDNAE